MKTKTGKVVDALLQIAIIILSPIIGRILKRRREKGKTPDAKDGQ